MCVYYFTKGIFITSQLNNEKFSKSIKYEDEVTK